MFYQIITIPLCVIGLLSMLDVYNYFEHTPEGCPHFLRHLFVLASLVAAATFIIAPLIQTHFP